MGSLSCILLSSTTQTFGRLNVFLISHPWETEINHKVQSRKPYFLRKPVYKEASGFTYC